MASDQHARQPEPPDVDTLMGDPSVSRHFKLVLDAWLHRDPVDAANDADLLSKVLGRRADTLLGSPS